MASAENGTGELGDLINSALDTSRHHAPALDLSPDANNHSATEALHLPFCILALALAPKPFSKYQTQTGGDYVS